VSADTTRPGGSVRVSPWRRGYHLVAPVAAFVLVYFAVLVYPAWRILSLAFPGWQPGTPELAMLMAGPAATRLICEWRAVPARVARIVSAVVMTWLGVCFIGFCLVAPWELASILLPLPSRGSGLVLLAATLTLAAAGFANAQHLHLRTLRIPAPAPVRGLTLVQLTDVHVGSRSGGFLRRAVRTANRALPDYVLITGDLVDFRHIGAEQLACLAELTAPAFFIIGNHERYVDCDAICARLTDLGVTVLRNRSVRFGGLQLVGIDDAEPKSQVSRVLEHLEPAPDAFRILLYHRPDGVADAARWGAHLMLCGHTHNGQLVPFNYVVRRVFPHICGLYQVDGLHLYVSPGTGTWGPLLRLGSRCEVTAIRLV
jgi:hypothetical protein